MLYNELHQIIGLGLPLEQLGVMAAAGSACGVLEDFLFTTPDLGAIGQLEGHGAQWQGTRAALCAGDTEGLALGHPASGTSRSGGAGLLWYHVSGLWCHEDPLTHQTWQMARWRRWCSRPY